MLRSLADGRGGGLVQRGGRESGCSGGGGRGSDEGGRMSCLVPLPACALMECGVTWKRPSFSLPLSETRILCPSQKRHCPPPDTLPVSRLALSSKNTHSQKCMWKHRDAITRTQVYTHTYRCALLTQWMSIKFPSNRNSELRSNKHTKSHYP